MSSYHYTDDNSTVERLSEQRDDIYEYVVERFRYHVSNNDNDDAIALADEFYEWLDPNQLEEESTAFFDEHELRNLYLSLTDD